MTGKTHLAGGLLAGVLIERFTALSVQDGGTISAAGIAIPLGMLAVAATLFGALLPDIDEPRALLVNAPSTAANRMARRTQPAWRVEIGPLSSLLRILLRALSAVLRLLAGGHRGATHWLISALAAGAAFWLLGGLVGYPQIGVWILGGYLSHLVLDMFTPSGLEVLMPLSRRSVGLLPRALRVQTGGLMDAVFGVVLLMLALYLYIS